MTKILIRKSSKSWEKIIQRLVCSSPTDKTTIMTYHAKAHREGKNRTIIIDLTPKRVMRKPILEATFIQM